MRDDNDSNEENPSKEEDKVAAAYENISKKLDSIRSGQEADDDSSESEDTERSDKNNDDLEEWKGPKGMKEGESEDDDFELRKVKLGENSRNDDEEDEEEVKEIRETKRPFIDSTKEEKEDKEDEEDEEEDKPKEKWEPVEDDPLDKEDEEKDEDEEETAVDSDEDSKQPEKFAEKDEDLDEVEEEIEKPTTRADDMDDEIEKPVSQQEFRSRIRETRDVEEEVPVKHAPQPDTLDDLTEDPRRSRFNDEDSYDIPNLKTTRQTGDNMEYNTHSQKDLYGNAYHHSGANMDNMQTNDPNNFFSQHNQPQAPKRANKFHLLILVIIGVAVIGFTVYILKGGFGEINIAPTPSPSPSPEVTVTPTPTPAPESKRSDIKVRVLNGSGKTGLAKTVADKLKELGYQIDKTGNATNSAFTQTIVRVKTKDEGMIPQIVKDLSPDFDATGNTSLTDDNVEVEIILGTK